MSEIVQGLLQLRPELAFFLPTLDIFSGRKILLKIWLSIDSFKMYVCARVCVCDSLF